MNESLIDDTLQQTHHFRVAWENAKLFLGEDGVNVGGESWRFIICKDSLSKGLLYRYSATAEA